MRSYIDIQWYLG